MLKTKTTSTTNGNGRRRLPKASDFKLPKRLDLKTRRLIETSEAVMEELRKAREKREISEK